MKVYSPCFCLGWFEGLSQKFLSCEAPKILILAGNIYVN